MPLRGTHTAFTAAVARGVAVSGVSRGGACGVTRLSRGGPDERPIRRPQACREAGNAVISTEGQVAVLMSALGARTIQIAEGLPYAELRSHHPHCPSIRSADRIQRTISLPLASR